MSTPTRGRRAIELGSASIVLASLTWGAVHLVSVRSHPWDDPQSAWLIWPLFIALVVCAPFVLWSARGQTGAELVEDSPGLADPAQVRFVLGVAAMIASAWAFGFALVAAIGPPALAFWQGEQKLAILALLAVLPLAIVVLGFVWALSIDVPLLPLWM